MQNLIIKTVMVKGSGRNNLICALLELAQIDDDFNGNNGPACLWDEAKGYSSNMDFLLGVIAHIKSDTEFIAYYVETWMNRSKHFSSHKGDIIIDNGNVQVISLAIISA